MVNHALDQLMVGKGVGVCPLAVELLARQLRDSILSQGGPVGLALLALVGGGVGHCFVSFYDGGWRAAVRAMGSALRREWLVEWLGKAGEIVVLARERECEAQVIEFRTGPGSKIFGQCGSLAESSSCTTLCPAHATGPGPGPTGGGPAID